MKLLLVSAPTLDAEELERLQEMVSMALMGRMQALVVNYPVDIKQVDLPDIPKELEEGQFKVAMHAAAQFDEDDFDPFGNPGDDDDGIPEA